jgi:hypothetical protein
MSLGFAPNRLLLLLFCTLLPNFKPARAAEAAPAPKAKPNVLFIAVDELRDWGRLPR